MHSIEEMGELIMLYYRVRSTWINARKNLYLNFFFSFHVFESKHAIKQIAYNKAQKCNLLLCASLQYTELFRNLPNNLRALYFMSKQHLKLFVGREICLINFCKCVVARENYFL